jgi:hypothetical protein
MAAGAQIMTAVIATEEMAGDCAEYREQQP